MRRVVFDCATRLVRELAEVDFDSVRGSAQHIDVSARAEDSGLKTSQHDNLHFGMFESNALNSISQLDIDAEVIGVEFEFVAFIERFVFLDIHGKGGPSPVDIQFPVAILFRRRLKIDHASLSRFKKGTRSNVRSNNKARRDERSNAEISDFTWAATINPISLIGPTCSAEIFNLKSA